MARVTAAAVRRLALALEGATEVPHFDRAAFRTTKRIFLTMGPTGEEVNLAFDLLLQSRFCDLAPDAFAPVPGGWGRMGFTTCRLAKVDAATFREAVRAAHARAVGPKRAPKKKKA